MAGSHAWLVKIAAMTTNKPHAPMSFRPGAVRSAPGTSPPTTILSQPPTATSGPIDANPRRSRTAYARAPASRSPASPPKETESEDGRSIELHAVERNPRGEPSRSGRCCSCSNKAPEMHAAFCSFWHAGPRRGCAVSRLDLDGMQDVRRTWPRRPARCPPAVSL